MISKFATFVAVLTCSAQVVPEFQAATIHLLIQVGHVGIPLENFSHSLSKPRAAPTSHPITSKIV